VGADPLLPARDHLRPDAPGSRRESHRRVGSSYSAAHSYVVAAIDRRVKAVCGQGLLVSGRRAFEMLVRIDFWEQTWQLLAADRQSRARGEAPAMLPVVDPDPTAQSALPTPDSHEFFGEYEGSSWRNEVTLRSVELFQGYEPGEYLRQQRTVRPAGSAASPAAGRSRAIAGGGKGGSARAKVGAKTASPGRRVSAASRGVLERASRGARSRAGRATGAPRATPKTGAGVREARGANRHDTALAEADSRACTARGQPRSGTGGRATAARRDGQ